MKNFKKLVYLFICCCLCVSSLSVYAKEEQKENDFYYVVMGDSIATAYGLAAEGQQNGGITTANYKNDPENGYGRIVADQLLDVLGIEDDVYNHYSNISSSGAALSDIIQYIYDEDYYMENLASMMKKDPEVLQYHDIYVSEIAKADLITLEAGNNDVFNMALARIGEDVLVDDPNPILLTIYYTFSDSLYGTTHEGYSIDNLTEKIQNGEISISQVIEAVNYLSEDNLTEICLDAVEKTKAEFPETIAAIRSVNPDAAIVLLGLYNPLDMSTKETEESGSLIDKLINSLSSKAIEATIGKVIEKGITELNSFIQSYAASEKNMLYVDVTGTETNEGFDFHPNADGHQYIADQILKQILLPVTANVTGSDNVTVTGPAQTIYNCKSVYTINNLGIRDGARVTVNGQEISLENNQFTINSTENVTIEVSVYDRINAIDLPFEDVSEDKWYYSVVRDAYGLGLMTGVDSTHFKPYDNITRGMVATVLYRMAGSPAIEYSDQFTDVPDGKYYSDAVSYLASQSIIKGTTPTTFAPSKQITRQDLAVMLCRFASEYYGLDISYKEDLSSFEDASSVSNYAASAVKWAVESGIIGGKTRDGKLYIDPKANATRAECAKMLLALYNLGNQ